MLKDLGAEDKIKWLLAGKIIGKFPVNGPHKVERLPIMPLHVKTPIIEKRNWEKVPEGLTPATDIKNA
jgi:hypothetical protein